MASAGPANKSTGRLLIIAVLVVVLAAMGLGAWVLLNPRAAPSAATAAAATRTPTAKPVFFKLDPFTVNLEGGDFGDKLLYVAITLQVDNEATREYFQDHLPQVRNRLLMVLSDQDADALTSSQGKQKLAASIRTSLVNSFAAQQPQVRVHKVLFTQFILQ